MSSQPPTPSPQPATLFTQPARTKKNVLSTSQIIAFGGALKANAARFAQERPTMPEAARQLSEMVGFSVTGNQVDHMATELNVRWRAKQVRTPQPPRDKALKLSALAAKLDLTATTLADLLVKLGQPANPALRTGSE